MRQVKYKLESTKGKESNVRPKSEIVTKPKSDRKQEKVDKSKFIFEPGQGHNFTSEIKSGKLPTNHRHSPGEPIPNTFCFLL